MKSPDKEEPQFSWWDTIKAFYYLVDTKRRSYLFYTLILILVLFYDLVPIVVVSKIVDFFTTYTPGSSLSLFYIYIAFLTISLMIVSIVRLSVKKRLSGIKSDVTYFTRVRGYSSHMSTTLL